MSSEKVPVPEEVHCTLVKLLAVAPAVTFTEEVEEHIEISVPTFTIALGTIVRVLVAETLGQFAFVAVSVKVTLPAAISVALGV